MSDNELTGWLNMLSRDIEDYFNELDILKKISNRFSLVNSELKDYCSKNISENNNILSELLKDKLYELSELQSNIDNQLNKENGMIPETTTLDIVNKIAMASATLLVISIALAWVMYEKKNKNKNGLNKITYQPHHLLLIIPANQSDGYETGKPINNEQVNKLIANSVRAYCFSGGKDVTNEIADGIRCNDEVIDNTTASRVFVHLLLSAEPSIIDERIRLNISDKIEPKTTIEIVKIAKLQTARSTTAFYEI